MRSEVVVVGAGLAGLSAALRLAESGLDVVVVAQGVGSLHLGGATVDVLGYAGEENPNSALGGCRRVDSPAQALPRFVAAHPEHPYARIGQTAVAESLEWFKARAGAPFVGGLDRNRLYPTAVGTPKPSVLVPASIAGGDLTDGGRVVIAGFRALKDFYAQLVAANLTASGLVAARAVEVDVTLPAPLAGEADPGPLGFARSFDDPEFRKAVIASLEGVIDGDESIGFPAVLGLDDSVTAWTELSDALGRPVFEIPTLPPSIPGIRLYKQLVGALKGAGARIVIGSRVVGGEGNGSRLEGVRVATGTRTTIYAAGAFVLASGGVSAGGIAMDSRWRIAETALGLPIMGAPAPQEPRFSTTYLEEHPVDRVGVAVDGLGRPVEPAGEVVWENLYAAGATLAGARPWAEKSGNGISLASGWHAAGSILKGSV